jgi:hypothetical protein
MMNPEQARLVETRNGKPWKQWESYLSERQWGTVREDYSPSGTAWLEGDPAMPTPPSDRHKGRNAQWFHLESEDILSMPDKCEYPWFAAWDLAFHAIPIAMIDPDFAKRQLDVITREWFMHPNGQIPAYSLPSIKIDIKNQD